MGTRALSQAPTQAQILDKVPIASPTAASLGKFADIPVSYHTGIPSISIPIYTVKEGPLQLPISLEYHASGLKVMEQASWVGAGWTLNCGGVVTRTVKGTPDEILGGDGYGYLKDKGYYSYLYRDPIVDDHPVLDYMDFANGKKDGEPDLFFFNVNGYTGKFFFRPDNTTVLIPQQDVRIDPLFCTSGMSGCNPTNEGLYGWVITTPDGVKYHFGKELGNQVDVQPIERTLPYSTTGGFVYTDLKTMSSWYLRKIESPEGLFSINLKYAKEEYSFYTVALSPVINGSGNGMNLAKNFMFGVRLSSIEFSNGSVTFKPETGARQDLSSSNTTVPSFYDWSNTNDPYKAKALKEIIISGGDFPKSFKLTHSYFSDSEPLHGKYGTTDPALESVYNLHSDRKRLRLDKITERSYDSTISKPPHIFEYFEETEVPRTLSLAQDHWGFYNGAVSNESMIPPYSTDGGFLFTTGAERGSKWPEMRAGSLKRITYPTGGSTDFSYGSHSVFVNRPNFMPPVHKFDISARGNGSFAISDPIHSVIVTTRTKFKLKMRNFQGGTGTIFFGAETFTPATNAEWEERAVVMDPGTYSFYCTSGSSGSNQGLEASLYELQQYNYQWTSVPVGGLRIEQLTHKDFPSNATIVQNFAYVDSNGDAQGVLYSQPSYIGLIRNDRLAQSGAYAGTDVNGNVVANPSDGCLKWDPNNRMYYVSPSSIFPMQTTQGNHFGYNEVKVTQADGGYTVYRYRVGQNHPGDVMVNMVDISQCDAFSPNFPPAPEPHNFSRGELRSVQSFNSSGILLKETQSLSDYTLEQFGIHGLIVKNVGEFGMATEYELKTAKKTKTTSLELTYNANSPSQPPVGVMTETYFDSPNHGFQSRTVISDVVSGNQITNAQKDKILKEIRNKYVADVLTASCANQINTYNCDDYLQNASSTLLTNYLNGISSGCDANCRYASWQGYINSLNNLRTNYVGCRIEYNSDLKDACQVSPSASTELKALMTLKSRNEIGAVLETSQWRDGKILKSGYTNFQDFGTGIIFPSQLNVINFSSPQASTVFAPFTVTNTAISKDVKYQKEESYTYANGNIVEVTGKNGVKVAYLWGYNNNLPIVKAVNASYSTLSAAYTAVSGNLTNLRTHPSLSNAQVTTYTYDPLVGMTSQTDPNGIMSTYSYDKLGRLDHVKDNDGNVVQKQNYYYQVR